MMDALVEVASSSQFRRYSPQAQSSALGLFASERLRQPDDVRSRLGMTLTPLDLLSCCDALAPARGRELGDEGRLLELGDGAEDLAHKGRGWGVLDEVRGRRRRDEGASLCLEHVGV